ncbi:hypothetical protein Aperf_G00000123950 [Anoplocephala perfoliata]
MRFILDLLILFIKVCFASKVILVSLDGFRHDYIEMAEKAKRNVSAFQQMTSEGFRGMKVRSVMTSITFPSHYSLATGRYVDRHGLVGDTFYDPESKDIFVYSNDTKNLEPKWFTMNNNEPIWLTVQRNGGKSGVLYWPGSGSRMYGEMEYVNYGLYNRAPDLRFCVDRVMDWITTSDVNFVAMYYAEPDSAGHKYGPDSKEVLDAIEEVNDGIAYLLQRIDESTDLTEKPNVIVTSDHGMTTVNISKTIPLYKYLNLDEYLAGVNSSPATLGIWPLEKGISADAIYNKIKNMPNCKVYKKTDIPDEYHFKNNDRIAPVIVIADPGWVIQTNESNPYQEPMGGMHGYNNSLPDMHPFLVASGPDIRNLGQVDTFHQVDIYALVCLLLKIYVPNTVDSDVMRVVTYVKTLPSLEVLEQFDRYAKGLDPLPGDPARFNDANIPLVFASFLAFQMILRC